MKDIKIQTIKYYSILDNIKKFILSIYPYVICIVVHGSVARGDVELFSDIDISAIVLDEDISKVKDRRISKIINNTVVNISILSISEFISIFGTRDIYEVIWKKAVTPESKPLYDPYNIFSHLLSACEVDVDENLEEQILYRTYTSSLIFMGKINNAYIRNDIPYLLDSALMLAHQIAHIILTINKIYINSWEYIYKLLKLAKIKPPNFWERYEILAGYNRKASPTDIVKTAYSLIKDIQEILKEKYNKNTIKNKYFRDILYTNLDFLRIL